MIGYDSFSEFPGTPRGRDELDGKECDAVKKEEKKKLTPVSIADLERLTG